MAIAFLGLGSNLGDRGANLQRAIRDLEDHGIAILRRSAILETEPVGGPPQGLFLNAVIKIQTDLEPCDLLKVIKQIEARAGRVKIAQDGPRTLDIDILLYNYLVLKTPFLTIPHPRMLDRGFVMRPLAEIEPQLVRELRDARH